MSIIFKFVAKNMKSNKFRTFLIIFSICVSTALFFSSMAISSTMEGMYLQRMKSYYGSSEIIIHTGPDSPARFVNPYKARQCEGIEYAVGMFQAGGYYKPNTEETVRLTVRGIDFEDLYKLDAIAIRGEADALPFLGSKIIVGKTMADKHQLSLGDTINIDIGNSKRKFTIAAISEPVGFFAEDGNSVSVVLPLKTLSGFYGAKGNYTEIYIKLKNSNETNKALDLLSEKYKGYVVRETISKAQLKNIASDISTPFIMMTGIVLFMSIFIMYTSYKVIIAERLPVIGTFRSIGAERRTANFALLFESGAYGIIGGFFGCILGVGILFLMAKILMPVWAGGIGLRLKFTLPQAAMAFMLALTLSIISSYFPIRRAAKTSIKDIIFASLSRVSANKRWKAILGVPLFIICILLPPLLPRKLTLPLGFACMILSTLAMVLLIPSLTSLFLKLLERFYSSFPGNEGILAAKNLKQNKSIINNIALLAIGVSSILMINTVSTSVIKEITNFYKNVDFDISMWTYNADKNILNSVRSIEGVESVYGVFEAYGLAADRNNVRIGRLQGIDINKFPEFVEIDFGSQGNEALKELDAGRNILIAEGLKDQLMVKEGDVIGIEMGGSIRKYNVIGVFKSLMHGGSYALISEKYFKLDTGDKYFSDIYVKAYKDPEQVAEYIKKKLARRQPWVMSMQESQRRDQQSNKMLFDIMTGFSIAAMIIGIFGVLNNYTISFIERKRYLAMYRSMGMSKMQMIKMIFIEAFTGGIIGGLMGVIGGTILIYIVPYTIKSLGLAVSMHYSPYLISASLLTGIIISLIASISPALKSTKLSIIDSIRYEC